MGHHSQSPIALLSAKLDHKQIRRDAFVNAGCGSITFTGGKGHRAAVYEDIKINGTGTN